MVKWKSQSGHNHDVNSKIIIMHIKSFDYNNKFEDS